MADSTNKNTSNNGSNPLSLTAATVPPRAIPIKKESAQELLDEAFKLVWRNATATVSPASHKSTIVEEFMRRKITVWSGGDGVITMKYKELRWDFKNLFASHLIKIGVDPQKLDAYEWQFGGTPFSLMLSSENMRNGLTPESIAKLFRRSVHVVLNENNSPVTVRYSVDKRGCRYDVAWLKSFSKTGYRFPQYLGNEPVTVFNTVADFCDAGGIAPKVDRRYYYAAA